MNKLLCFICMLLFSSFVIATEMPGFMHNDLATFTNTATDETGFYGDFEFTPDVNSEFILSDGSDFAIDENLPNELNLFIDDSGSYITVERMPGSQSGDKSQTYRVCNSETCKYPVIRKHGRNRTVYLN